MIDYKDEILAEEACYRLLDEKKNVIHNKVYIEMIAEVLQAGTPLNKAFFDILCPSGLICMWSGSTAPKGWYLCDGTNGTPDLRDRFIVGAGNEYSVGDTGGEKEVILTVAQMPEHSHTYTRASSGTTALAGKGEYGNGDFLQSISTSTQNTSVKGSGEAHENRPPYYALAYIMKA